MTPEQQAEAIRLWLFIEDRLAEDEAVRIEGLSDEDLDEEMREAGFDPSSAVTKSARN